MSKNNGAAVDPGASGNQPPNGGAQETPEQKAAREAAEAEAKAKAEEEAKKKASEKQTVKTVILRHKTTFPTYGRAGIRMTNIPKEYRVTTEQLAVLKADPWFEVIEQAEAAKK